MSLSECTGLMEQFQCGESKSVTDQKDLTIEEKIAIACAPLPKFEIVKPSYFCAGNCTHRASDILIIDK